MSLFLALVVALLAAETARGQAVVDADTLTTEEVREILDMELNQEDSWYLRSFNNYFGKDEADDEEAARGDPVRIDEPFRPYAGLRIRNVWIIRREAFGTVSVDTTAGIVEEPQELLETQSSGVGRVLNALASTTRERTVRRYLRFREGDRIDPFAFADSERMLRQRAYINDAKIEISVVEEEPGWADVVVLTRDRWPIGGKVKIITERKYTAELFHRSIAGTGLGIEYEVPVNLSNDPPVGHRVKGSYANVGGSYVDVSLQYRTQWDTDELTTEMNRGLIHPDIRIVGGLAHDQTIDKNNDDLPDDRALRFQVLDTWMGYTFRLGDNGRVQGRRVRLIPALRFRNTDYLAPPREFARREESWRDSKLYLAQLTLSGVESYTARLVYGYGQTEDIPAGYWSAVTGGFDQTELRERVYAGFRAARAVFSDRQSYLAMTGSIGAYHDGHRIRDGVVDLSLGGFGTLHHLGSSHLRNFQLLTYTRGKNRTRESELRLDEVAFRDLDSSDVSGDQRISAELESVLFTPYALLGFRIATFGYMAGGFVSDEGEALFEERFAFNLGTGFRLNNPRLVIPTTEFRFGLLSTAEGMEFRVNVKMGDLRLLRHGLPTSKPATVRYE